MYAAYPSNEGDPSNVVPVANVSVVMDFSRYSREQLFEPDETGYQPADHIPGVSLLLADGRRMLISHFTNFAAPAKPTILYDNQIAEGVSVSMETASVSSTGKAIAFGHLIELGE